MHPWDPRMQKAKSCKKPWVLPKPRVGIVRGLSYRLSLTHQDSERGPSRLITENTRLTHPCPYATPRPLSDLIPDLNLFLSPNFPSSSFKKIKLLDLKRGKKNPHQKKKNLSDNTILWQPQRPESETKGFRETDTDLPLRMGLGRRMDRELFPTTTDPVSGFPRFLLHVIPHQRVEDYG